MAVQRPVCTQWVEANSGLCSTCTGRISCIDALALANFSSTQLSLWERLVLTLLLDSLKRCPSPKGIKVLSNERATHHIVDIDDGGVWNKTLLEDPPAHQPPNQRCQQRRHRLHQLLVQDPCATRQTMPNPQHSGIEINLSYIIRHL